MPVDVTDAMAGLFELHVARVAKAGWETVERVFNSTDDDSNPGAQRIVSVSAGSTAVIFTAPNDLVYQLQPGLSCSPCRLVRVVSPTSGTLNLKLTWTGSGPRLNLWIAGTTYSSDGTAPIQVIVGIPVNAGEIVVYAGLVGGRPFATDYMTVTLATSFVPAPTGVSAPARDARRNR